MNNTYTTRRVLKSLVKAIRNRKGNHTAFIHHVKKKMKWDWDVCKKAIQEYFRFIYLKVRKRDYNATILSPSGIIDEMWHIHLLHTQSYHNMCNAFGGNYIHHNPEGALEVNEEARQKRYVETYEAYIIEFRSPDPVFWEPITQQIFVSDLPAPFRTISFFVKNLEGKTITLCLNSRTVIQRVKDEIQYVDGIPADAQRLIYAGHQLEDHKTLADYGIIEDTTIHMVLRLGGC